MVIFKYSSEFLVSKENLFAFHESEIGFNSLVGGDKNIEVLQKPSSLQVGEIAILRVPILPFLKWKWISKHTAYSKNEFFEDTQIQGPFPKFIHRHMFFEGKENKNSSILSDEIQIDFYFFFLSKWILLPMLKGMFSKRHKITAEALHTKHKLLFCGYT